VTVLAVFGVEEPFLAVPVAGVTAGVSDRLPLAMNLISADAIWSGVALVLTLRDDASAAGWSFEKTIPSETLSFSLDKATLLGEATSLDEAGESGSGIGAASRRLIRWMKPPPTVWPWDSIFGGSAAGLG
jgi:hypothetical protein